MVRVPSHSVALRNADAAKATNLSRAPRYRRTRWSHVTHPTDAPPSEPGQQSKLRSSTRGPSLLRRAAHALLAVGKLNQAVVQRRAGGKYVDSTVDSSGGPCVSPIVVARDVAAPDGLGMQLQVRLSSDPNSRAGFGTQSDTETSSRACIQDAAYGAGKKGLTDTGLNSLLTKHTVVMDAQVRRSPPCGRRCRHNDTLTCEMCSRVVLRLCIRPFLMMTAVAAAMRVSQPREPRRV